MQHIRQMHPGMMLRTRMLELAKRRSTFELWTKLIPFAMPRDRMDQIALLGSTGLMLAGKQATMKVPKLMAEVIQTLGDLGRVNNTLHPKERTSGNSNTELIVQTSQFDRMSHDAIAFSLFGMLTKAYLFKVFNIFCGESRHVLFAPLMQKTSVELSRRTFDAVHNIPLLALQEMQLGEIASVQSRGIKAVNNLLTAVFFRGFPCALEFALVSRLLMKTIGLKAAAVSVASVTLFTKFTFDMSASRVRQRRLMNDRENQLTSEFVDSLINAEPIRYFAAEKLRGTKFVGLAQAFERSQKRVSESLAFLNFGQSFIFHAGIYICQALALRQILQHTAEGKPTGVADLILVTDLLNQLAVPLNFSGVIYREAKNAMQDLKALNRLTTGQILDSPMSSYPTLMLGDSDGDTPQLLKPSSSNHRILLSKPQELIFDKVSYAYPPRGSLQQNHYLKREVISSGHSDPPSSNPVILKDVSFKMDPSEFCAIVGRSGAGKSTIIKLIFRLMEPTHGRIYLGNTPIDEIDISEWRRYLGIVPQDIPLFNDSLRSNITMGDPTFADQKLRDALSMSHLDSFVERLPNGLDTTVGQRGMALSGGERQRLALSRCLLRDPKLVIFDEATSSLDLTTERQIMECATSDRLKDVSRLVVAHRLTSIRNADRIMVFDQGRLTEQGSHDDLLRSYGPYWNLWREQIRGE